MSFWKRSKDNEPSMNSLLIKKIIKSSFLALVVSLFLMMPNFAKAAGQLADASWGYSLQSGVSIGTVTKPVEKSKTKGSSKSKSQSITVGGIPVIVTANTDYSHEFGIALGGSLLFDIPNSQISQQVIRASLLWHVLGGAKQLVHGQTDSDYYMISRTSSQFSLLLQGALIRYAASSKDLSVKVTGSTFETRFGMRYRFNFNWINAGGVELLGTIFSIPADEERVESQTVELSFFWQV